MYIQKDLSILEDFFFYEGDIGRLEAVKSRGRPSKRTILNKFPLLIRLANENSSHIHVYLSIN